MYYRRCEIGRNFSKGKWNQDEENGKEVMNKKWKKLIHYKSTVVAFFSETLSLVDLHEVFKMWPWCYFTCSSP